MPARHRVRKAAARRAHVLRLDARRPAGAEPLSTIRKRARDERRAAKGANRVD